VSSKFEENESPVQPESQNIERKYYLKRTLDKLCLEKEGMQMKIKFKKNLPTEFCVSTKRNQKGASKCY
jgi:hypothetical protein